VRPLAEGMEGRPLAKENTLLKTWTPRAPG